MAVPMEKNIPIRRVEMEPSFSILICFSIIRPIRNTKIPDPAVIKLRVVEKNP